MCMSFAVFKKIHIQQPWEKCYWNIKVFILDTLHKHNLTVENKRTTAETPVV